MSFEPTLSTYPESAFGGFTRVDGTVAFYTRVNALIGPEDTVLDVGCGRGQRHEDPNPYRRGLSQFRGRCARVLGIDVDTAGEENPLLDEFRLITDLAHWPVEDASVDVIVSDFVLEHIQDPDAYFREVNRVLRPGGYFCARTPNMFGYVALAARLIPNRLHARVVSQVQEGREERDVFPTVYRCNRKGTVLQVLARHGLEGHVLRQEAEPSYLHFSPALYRVGAVLGSLLPPVFRNSLLIFARKPSA